MSKKEQIILDKVAEEYVLDIKAKPYGNLVKDAFKAGAKWQKTQMMKEAVEGYVNYYEDFNKILITKTQINYPYHIGDKVKIMIVKEE